MQPPSVKYSDVLIAGGGLAGLSMAALLAYAGHKVTVIEQGEYPRQKVCGEFVSMESRPFLESLGIVPRKMNLPEINRFRLTSGNGYEAACKLTPGGFGISRYKLDTALAEVAKNAGVNIVCRTRVRSFNPYADKAFPYNVRTSDKALYAGKVVINALGRGGADKEALPGDTANHQLPFVGVKYHVAIDFPADLIEIHGFRGGYCGLSKVEEGKYCLCYLTDSNNVKAFKGDLEAFESNIPAENMHLSKRLDNMEKLTKPVTTSRFYFGAASAVNNGILAAGDAGGFIPPITGNGMSLAFRCAHALTPLIHHFLNGDISRQEMESKYKKFHKHRIGGHISKGKLLQSLFMANNSLLNTVLFSGLKFMPGMMPFLTRQAFGKEFGASAITGK